MITRTVRVGSKHAEKLFYFREDGGIIIEWDWDMGGLQRHILSPAEVAVIAASHKQEES